MAGFLGGPSSKMIGILLLSDSPPLIRPEGHPLDLQRPIDAFRNMYTGTPLYIISS